MKYLLLAAVTLGGAFGSASAEVVSIEGNVMVVDLEVDVQVSVQSVVAHLSFEDDTVLTLPLLGRGGETFGVTTAMEAKNYIVVFEAIGPDSESSDPVSLTQLGAEFGPESGTTTTTTEPDAISPENQRMLWLAVAAGAASLSVLAFWVLGPKDKKDDDQGSDEEE